MLYIGRRAAEIAFGPIAKNASHLRVAFPRPLKFEPITIPPEPWWDEVMLELVDEDRIIPWLEKRSSITADELETRIWLYRSGNLPTLRVRLS